VRAIPQHTTLREAAHLLTREGISGAPVVDADGVCVGVMSATDFLALVEGDRRGNRASRKEPVCVCSDWQVMDVHELPADEVSRHMTADPVTVRPGTPVGELSRLMLDAHIHRLIVVNGQGRPVGIVSSTDIIAAVAHTGAPHPEAAHAAS
jgi:CBS domain-containing protein